MTATAASAQHVDCNQQIEMAASTSGPAFATVRPGYQQRYTGLPQCSHESRQHILCARDVILLYLWRHDAP